MCGRCTLPLFIRNHFTPKNIWIISITCTFKDCYWVPEISVVCDYAPEDGNDPALESLVLEWENHIKECHHG